MTPAPDGNHAIVLDYRNGQRLVLSPDGVATLDGDPLPSEDALRRIAAALASTTFKKADAETEAVRVRCMIGLWWCEPSAPPAPHPPF